MFLLLVIQSVQPPRVRWIIYKESIVTEYTSNASSRYTATVFAVIINYESMLGNILMVTERWPL